MEASRRHPTSHFWSLQSVVSPLQNCYLNVVKEFEYPVILGTMLSGALASSSASHGKQATLEGTDWDRVKIINEWKSNYIRKPCQDSFGPSQKGQQKATFMWTHHLREDRQSQLHCPLSGRRGSLDRADSWQDRLALGSWNIWCIIWKNMYQKSFWLFWYVPGCIMCL